jgi:hypothetical protein
MICLMEVLNHIMGINRSWRSCYTKGFNGSIPKDSHIIVKVICGSIGFRPP